MPDDMLKDAIETSRRVISSVDDFELEGKTITLEVSLLHSEICMVTV